MVTKNQFLIDLFSNFIYRHIKNVSKKKLSSNLIFYELVQYLCNIFHVRIVNYIINNNNNISKICPSLMIL